MHHVVIGGQQWRQLRGVALVCVAFILAALVNVVFLPQGHVVVVLYAVPLFHAALTWPARTVVVLAGLAVVVSLVTAMLQAVPVSVTAVLLIGLVFMAGLAIQVARLRAIVREVGQARDEFLAAAAHDLKNPLTLIRGQVYLLRRQGEQAAIGTPERAAQLARGLEQIDSAASRTLALLNALLDTVRLDAGAPLDLTRHPVDLVTLARRVVATYQASTDLHRIVVQSEVPGLVGLWDGFRLERVLENLLSNAIKYSPHGGEITVTIGAITGTRSGAPRTIETATHPGAQTAAVRWARLSVRDQGVGIPSSDLRRVFEPYRRGRNAARLAHGAGIGLAGAQRIVAQHGGTIAVESVEGQGSTFTVWLPLASAGAAQTPAPGATQGFSQEES